MAKHSSIGIEIKVGEKGSEQLISGLTDIPDMGAAPEKLDVTTLADEYRQYINGVKDFGDLEFTFIYETGENANYATLAAMEGQGVKSCVVTFPDKSTFSFEGEISVRIVGVGVNAVITFVMSVALQSEIVYNAGQGA